MGRQTLAVLAVLAVGLTAGGAAMLGTSFGISERTDRIDKYVAAVERWEAGQSAGGRALAGSVVVGVGPTETQTEVLELTRHPEESTRGHESLPSYTPAFEAVRLDGADLPTVDYTGERPSTDLEVTFQVTTAQQPDRVQSFVAHPVHVRKRNCPEQGCNSCDGEEKNGFCRVLAVALEFCVRVDAAGNLLGEGGGCDALVLPGAKDSFDPAGAYTQLPRGDTLSLTSGVLLLRSVDDPYVAMADATNGSMSFGVNATGYGYRAGGSVMLGFGVVFACVLAVCVRRHNRKGTGAGKEEVEVEEEAKEAKEAKDEEQVRDRESARVEEPDSVSLYRLGPAL